MKIIIDSRKGTVEAESVDEPQFLLTNKKGGFLLLGARDNVSKYNGIFFMSPKENDFEIFKVIDDIRLIGSSPEALSYSLTEVHRQNQHTQESFMLNNSNTLVYEVRGYLGSIAVNLDCRRIYDYTDMGKRYEITQEDGLIIIHYTKHKDHTMSELDYELYCVIKGAQAYEVRDNWIRKEHPFDRKRGSGPFESYVYEGLVIPVNGAASLIMSYSTDLDEARFLVNHVEKNIGFIRRTKGSYMTSLVSHAKDVPKKEIDAALRCSVAALDQLHCENGRYFGIYAGLPWFFQFWTRDEAISLKALIAEERYSDVKTILFRHIKNILDGGRIPNRYPESMLGSADGVGWTFRRVHDLIASLQKKKRLDEFISHDDLEYLYSRLEKSIQGIRETHSIGGLIINKPLETWMDTSFEDDTREGARIEIQALMLGMYRLMQALCILMKRKDRFSQYADMEKKMAKEVRDHFWKKPLLFDGDNDPTIRPNVFIASYIYPDLLTAREWTACFDNALSRLWLDWGGLSTIDRSHPWFTENYTGENNRSYHRGDSWFFLNCIAAIAMYRVNRQRYRTYIKKIIDAAAKECLTMGVIGHNAEVSSASGLAGEGSLSQAWSSAMFIELLDTVDVDFIFRK
jgi:glycogen debranching enzyme